MKNNIKFDVRSYNSMVLPVQSKHIWAMASGLSSLCCIMLLLRHTNIPYMIVVFVALALNISYMYLVLRLFKVIEYKRSNTKSLYYNALPLLDISLEEELFGEGYHSDSYVTRSKDSISNVESALYSVLDRSKFEVICTGILVYNGNSFNEVIINCSTNEATINIFHGICRIVKAESIGDTIDSILNKFTSYNKNTVSTLAFLKNKLEEDDSHKVLKIMRFNSLILPNGSIALFTPDVHLSSTFIPRNCYRKTENGLKRYHNRIKLRKKEFESTVNYWKEVLKQMN